MLVTFHLIHR